MAGESARVLVRLFAFQRHRGGRDLYRLANAEVTRLAAVDNLRGVFSFQIGRVLVDVDLADSGCQRLHAVLQVQQLRRRKIHHVIAEVRIHQLFFLGDGLEEFAELCAQLRALVFEFVIGLLQLIEILEGAFFAVRHFDGAGLGLVFVEILLLAFLRRRAACRFDVVGRSIHIRAAVGEDVLHR